MIKKLLSLLTIAVVLGGCAGENRDDNGKKGNSFGPNVIVVNGCQYVIYKDVGNASIAMVHAGNCNNSEHKIK